MQTLMQCIAEAKAEGENPGYPIIHYLRSTPHFPGRLDGLWDEKYRQAKDLVCMNDTK